MLLPIRGASDKCDSRQTGSQGEKSVRNRVGSRRLIMLDKPFFRKSDESIEEWQARLAAMNPVHLSCRLRERRKIWLDMAQQALRKKRRERKTSRRSYE